MGVLEELMERSGGKCELCSSTEDLDVLEVEPSDKSAQKSILVCKRCKDQILNPETIEPNYWRCLSESMWSSEPAVQVMAYRILKRIASEGWPQDLLDILYLEPDVQAWADAEFNEDDGREPTRDSNGTILEEGDTVIIIKDLDVKGTGFTAKRGTVVKNIHLTDNPEQIEGRVNGVKIVLLSKFLKKA